MKLDKGTVFIINENGQIETFGEGTALIFIQEKVGCNARVIQDGKVLEGVKSIEIRACVGEPTTHTIEYITGATKG